MKKRVGQITIKKIGRKYSVCISGTPQKLFSSFREAEMEVKSMRKKYGRRHYGYKNKRCKKIER